MMSQRAKSVIVPLAANSFQPPALILIVFKILLLTIWVVSTKPHSFAIRPLVHQKVTKNAKMLPSCLFPDANSEDFIDTSAHLPAQCSRQ